MQPELQKLTCRSQATLAGPKQRDGEGERRAFGASGDVFVAVHVAVAVRVAVTVTGLRPGDVAALWARMR